MKYLFISSDGYPPFRVDVTKLFGVELLRRGHSIDFLLPSYKTCRRSYKTTWAGCNVWVGANNMGTSTVDRCLRHIYQFINDLKIATLIRDNAYDFVLVKDKFLAAILAIIFCRVYQRKLIYWLSYPFPEANLYKSHIRNLRYRVIYRLRGLCLKYLLYRLILPTATHTFVQSEKMKHDIASEGIDESRLTPVPMGVELEDFERKNLSPVHDLGNHQKIIYLGNLFKVRRMDFLVHVFKIVHSLRPNTRLYFIGGSKIQSDIDDIRKEVERLQLEDAIELMGILPRELALAYTEQADVCVSPFFPTPILNSTSPTKIIEYMALKKAVVANNHPEQKLVIDQSGGGICVNYNEQEFAQAIIYLLDNPENAAAMGRHGRAYVEKHRTYSTIAEIVHKKFEEILLTPPV